MNKLSQTMNRLTVSILAVLSLLFVTSACKEKANEPAQSSTQQTTVTEKAEQGTAAEPAVVENSDGTTTELYDHDNDTPESHGQASANKQPMVYSIADDGFLNIREWPRSDARILGKLLTGGEGGVYDGSSANWHRVKYHGITGYVNGRYARVTGLEQSTKNISARKVYYVVIESYNDLRSAEDATRVMPDALSPCIFKANEGGRTLYRLCDGCYYSRKDAQEHASLIRQYLERDAWVWESNGTAVCVNQAVGLSGELVDISPK